MRINPGVEVSFTRAVALQVTVKDENGVPLMMLSNDPDFTGADWVDQIRSALQARVQGGRGHADIVVGVKADFRAGEEAPHLCMKPEMFGNTQHNLLGHYSGPWAVRAKAKELGLTIPDGREPDVMEKLRSQIRSLRRQLTDAEFADIVAAV